MSKSLSGHFSNTKGSKAWYNTFINLENTSIVWKYLEVTQENYPGTDLPRSFTLTTKNDCGKKNFWSHPNATKHMHEAILSIKDDPILKNSNPQLYTQFILYDYWRSVSYVTSSEFEYNKKIHVGNWELIFSKPRKEKDYPVIKHAKFTGLSR